MGDDTTKQTLGEHIESDSVSHMPSVCVVIPAHKRVVELRQAIAAAHNQTYPGELSILVVYDNAEPDLTLGSDGPRPVRVLHNTERTPGLAGARNTGILAARSEWIAFCDDDDVWQPTKLVEQMQLVGPATHFVTCSSMVAYEGRAVPRLAGTDLVTHQALIRSRMFMLASSTFVIRRSSLLGALGLVNEEMPGSQNEDWDLLLRASALAPIPNVDKPLVRVALAGPSSHFSRQWESKIEGSIWMLKHHADIAADKRGSARLMGQVAFAHACRGGRRDAWRWALDTMRRNPRQWRAYLASVVAIYPPSGEWALAAAHRLGRGV